MRSAIAAITAILTFTAHAQETVTVPGLGSGPGNQSQKSALLAVGLSLLIPGTGELYAGNNSAGRVMLGIDGALWMTYAGFVLHSDWVLDDARKFAAMRSGADFSGKDDRFDVNLGNYMTWEQYNEAKLRNREFEETYPASGHQWSWQSEQDRIRFRQLRIKSDGLRQSSGLVLGALVVNRIISAFMAWRSVRTHNEASQSGAPWDLSAELYGEGTMIHGMGLRLTTSF